MDSSMTAADWLVIAGYFGVLLVSGVLINRRSQGTTEDYFLGGGRIPAWAAAVSVVATSMSAASFIGVPQAGYVGDLTYLSTNIGMLLAAFVVAFVFVPAFYRSRVQTIYAYLGTRMGPGAGRAASLAFMVGRVFASGARIFIGAIPASIILFGDLEPGHLAVAIAVLAAVGVAYTLVGGVSSVIWSDVIQMGVLLGACAGAVGVILWRIDAPFGEIVHALGEPRLDGGGTGPSKLTLFDLTLDPRAPFSLPAAIIGFMIMGIGSYGTDHDLAQRLLTCRDAKAGARSILGGILLGVPSVLLFLIVGLLLYVFYQRPDLLGGPGADAPEDTRRVFLEFIIEEMPPGLSGLMMAGLFAAGLSSLNSAINAMSSTAINDFYRAWRPRATERELVLAGRVAVVGWGVVLAAFACACIWLERAHAAQGEQSTLLTFALTVMTFAYAGLIGVFLTALLTRRGNSASAVMALVAGFVVVAALQPMFWELFVDLDATPAVSAAAAAPTGGTGWPGYAVARALLVGVLDWAGSSSLSTALRGLLAWAFVWKLLIASAVSFLVCVTGSPGPRSA